MSTIAVLGTFDTKGEEHAYVAEFIRERGHQVLLIDAGSLDPPSIVPDVSREELVAATGTDLAASFTVVIEAKQSRSCRKVPL